MVKKIVKGQKAPKKVIVKKQGSGKEMTLAELQKLAHQGTFEAISKIEKYLETAIEGEKRAHAEIALAECELFYYTPRNEKEEEEFMLCGLIKKRERYIDGLEMKIEDISFGLDVVMLEKKVHEKVLANKNNKDKQEEWKYNWSEDHYICEKNDLQQIKEDIAYEEAGVAEAKKMVTTERYKNISTRHLEHYDFPFDDDENECGDDYDGCCCNE